MSRPEIIVLKFGGSVLTSEDDYAKAASEVYRWVREGRRVVAVASALAGVTGSLLEGCDGGVAEPPAGIVAELLATGERASAARLGLAVDGAGIECEVIDPSGIGLRVHGPRLDGEPVDLDCEAVRGALGRVPVVVVPGFFGLHVDGGIGLLGRGGSDLTAVFLAAGLGAACRLVKDVPGLFERDPDDDGPPPRMFRSITFERALGLDPRIIQHKAVRLAQEAGLCFEVAGLNGAIATRIGADRDDLAAAPLPPRPLRIGLLGLGTVGGGVHIAARRWAGWLQTGPAAVLDVWKPRPDVGEGVTLTTDAATVISVSDVVVEALPSAEAAIGPVRQALAAGRHVVTANKALVARHGPELRRLARKHGVRLACSAAVGGAAPILEAAEAWAGRIRRIEGVLNAASGFIFDQVAAGRRPAEALAAARSAGLTEADATLDLDGSDVAHKLAILAWAGFGVRMRPDEVARLNFEHPVLERAIAASRAGRVLRLVGTIEQRPGGDVQAAVRVCELATDHALARTTAARCAARFITGDGERLVTGRGAGRWPTTEAVMGDVLSLARLLAGFVQKLADIDGPEVRDVDEATTAQQVAAGAS